MRMDSCFALIANNTSAQPQRQMHENKAHEQEETDDDWVTRNPYPLREWSWYGWMEESGR